MIVNNLIADSINWFHLFGYTIITSFPLIPFLDLYQPKNKKFNKITFIKLGILSSSVLLSYYLFDNICLISYIENYFNPNKYEILTISQNTKNNLLLSIACTTLPPFIKNKNYTYLFFGLYYSNIIYSLII